MKNELKELAKLFLKLGSIAFGGPAEHIAMMEDKVTRKRKWMSKQHFLDLVGAKNLILGPNSTEMTMHCGHGRAGILGYRNYPWCCIQIRKKALKTLELFVLGTLTLVVTLYGVHEILALFTCGLVGLLLYSARNRKKTLKSFSPIILFQVIATLSTMKIFLTFLKVGAVLYGSGYVMFAFLDAELVNTGLLTREQLMDAVAVGQFTSGPVLSTATFIGWQLNRFQGALAATFGIFLPSFIFVALLNPLISKIRQSPYIAAFLDAINIAAVAVIVAVLIQMSLDALIDWKTILIAIVSIVTVFVFKKVNSAFIVLGGALFGFVLTLI